MPLIEILPQQSKQLSIVLVFIKTTSLITIEVNRQLSIICFLFSENINILMCSSQISKMHHTILLSELYELIVEICFYYNFTQIQQKYVHPSTKIAMMHHALSSDFAISNKMNVVMVTVKVPWHKSMNAIKM